MGIPEMCTLKCTHCRALLPQRRKCTPAKTLPTRVLSAGDTLTDSSKKDVPTERGSSARPLTKIRREKAGAATVRRGGSAAAVQRRRRSTSTTALVAMSISRASYSNEYSISTLPLTAEVPEERSPSLLPIDGCRYDLIRPNTLGLLISFHVDCQISD